MCKLTLPWLTTVLLCLSTTVAYTQENRDPYHRAPRDTVSQQVYDGWKQYELNCARCHGEYALGTSFAPRLTESLKETGPVKAKAMFLEIVCNGRPARGMPGWCELGLEKEKMEAMYAYVRGRAIGAIGPGRPALDPDLPPGVPKPKGGQAEPSDSAEATRSP